MRLLKRRIIVAILSVAMAFTMFPLLGADSAHADASDLYVGDALEVVVDPPVLNLYWAYNEENADYFLDPYSSGAWAEWEEFKNTLDTNYEYVSQVFVGHGIYGVTENFFDGLSQIKQISLPATISSFYMEDTQGVAKNAFRGLTGLNTVYYGSDLYDWNEIRTNPTFQPGNDAVFSFDPTPLSEAPQNMSYNNINGAKYIARTFVFTGDRKKIKLTYNGEELEEGFDYSTFPEVRSVGKHKINIAGKNHFMGYRIVSVKINPKGTYVKKVTSPAKKKIKVYWNRQSTKMNTSRITGYQVKVSRSKNFTKSTTSTSKVKGYKNTTKVFKVKKSHKRYYAKVRTYKVVNGVTYWSKWSKLKSRVSK